MALQYPVRCGTLPAAPTLPSCNLPPEPTLIRHGDC
jgi:hypothetical protein